MTSVSRTILFVLFNAAWQALLVGLLALAADRMLRGIGARYRHALWASALGICGALTLSSALRIQPESVPLSSHFSPAADQHAPVETLEATQTVPSTLQKSHGFTMPVIIVPFSRALALAVAGLYGLLLFYRSARLLQAWNRTRTINRSARRVELSSAMTEALGRCRIILGRRQVPVLASSRIGVPVTTGAMRPVVILPERLLCECDLPLLLSALGHEAAHIARRDYLFNLVYELISLPLWFHPAIQLVLRRIRQTRELRCDEIVTERLLEPRMYAQSLVQLAGAALPFGRPAATITVGIADADILEERIMRILKNSPARVGRRSALIIAALLFVIPCFALAPFAVHVSIHQPAIAATAAQNPGTTSGNQEQTPASEPLKLSTSAGEVTVLTSEPPNAGNVVRKGHTSLSLRANSQESLDAAAEAKARAQENARAAEQEAQNSEAEAKARAERKARMEESDQQRQERRDREEAELAERAKRQAELASIAKIPMDQAIQIAQRQTPGTVIAARLIGERGTVAYLISILVQKGDAHATALVLVNAIDGAILKTGESERAR